MLTFTSQLLNFLEIEKCPIYYFTLLQIMFLIFNNFPLLLLFRAVNGIVLLKFLCGTGMGHDVPGSNPWQGGG